MSVYSHEKGKQTRKKLRQVKQFCIFLIQRTIKIAVLISGPLFLNGETTLRLPSRVWPPLLLYAAFRTSCPVPGSIPKRKISWAGPCPSAHGCVGEQMWDIFWVSLCAELHLGLQCKMRSGTHLLMWLYYRSGLHWKHVLSGSTFYFMGEKREAFFLQMGRSQENRVRICDKTQNDWHVSAAHVN